MFGLHLKGIVMDKRRLNYESLRARPAIHKRARIVAAENNESLIDLTSRLLDHGLQREEEKIERLRSKESPTWSRPTD
jgi:hypothetical protein